MAVSFQCSCGKRDRLKEGVSGRKVRCPNCGNVSAVPRSDEEPEIEQEVADALLANDPDERPVVQIEEREEATPPPAPLRKAVPKPPAKKAPRRKAAPQKERVPWVAFGEGWFGTLNAGVIGGVLTILVAVAWFLLGLWAGRIFFYPPILAVIGVMAVLKGLLGGD
jgi:hypothetical protein